MVRTADSKPWRWACERSHGSGSWGARAAAAWKVRTHGTHVECLRVSYAAPRGARRATGTHAQERAHTHRKARRDRDARCSRTKQAGKRACVRAHATFARRAAVGGAWWCGACWELTRAGRACVLPVGEAHISERVARTLSASPSRCSHVVEPRSATARGGARRGKANNKAQTADG